MTLNEWLLILTWLVPLLLGLVQLARLSAPLPLIGAAAVPALLTALFVPSGTAYEMLGLLLGTVLALDAIGQVFLLFTAILWLGAALFAQAYLQRDARQGQFFAFFLLAMAGNFGLIVAADMFSFYLWFALMSFASYGLIVHSDKPEAYRAGQLYMLLVIVGEVALFSALVLINATTNTSRLAELSQRSIDDLSALLIAVSFGIKAGAVLLHLWLPLAHPAAPIPASAVLSGAMIKAGVLGWLRFLQPALPAFAWSELFLIAGLATAFYGAVMGVSQTNAKTVLAYSSISQMGFIMIGVGVWLLGGDLRETALIAVGLYAIHHALAKGALFLGVAFAGVNKAVPLLLLLPALALAGLPLTSGSVAKAALKSLTDQLAGGWAEALSLGLSLAAIGTTLLMARFLWLIWHTPAPHKPMPRSMWLTWFALLACVAGLLFTLPQASTAVSESLKESKLTAAVTPIAVGAAISALVALIAKLGAGRLTLRLPLVAAGDVLIIFSAIYSILAHALQGALQALAQFERRFVALWNWQRALQALSNISADLERRLRTDWLVSGGALLLLSLGVLLIVWLSA
jgi:formate hydrogenlyase subunit 3/multisubunit Na+/H+ antiporter MnhD subunit